GIGLGELLEQLPPLIRGHADANVGNGHLDPVAAVDRQSGLFFSVRVACDCRDFQLRTYSTISSTWPITALLGLARRAATILTFLYLGSANPSAPIQSGSCNF